MQLAKDNIGLVHLLCSIAALVAGAYVLGTAKGTRAHKQAGYVYTILMVLVNVTAFSIYRLFGRFGPFHYAAVLSSLSIVLGMVPAIIRWPKTSWKQFHAPFMYYSVVGLYAAFVSEIVTRIPGLPFGTMVFVGTFIVMFIGVYFFQKNIKRWMN